MSSALSALDVFLQGYSTTGPLGAFTPVFAVLLNALGVLCGFAIYKVMRGVIFELAGQPGDLSKIPGPPPANWLLGHVKYLLRPDYHLQIYDWANQYGKIYRFRVLFDHNVVVTDPAIAAEVLGRGENSVVRRTVEYQLFDQILGGWGEFSMFGTTDEVHWRNVRKTTAPAFSTGNIRVYYGVVWKHVQRTLGLVRKEQSALGHVDLPPLLADMMLAATLEGLFDVPNPQERRGYSTLGHDISYLNNEANQLMKNPLDVAFRKLPFATLLSRHAAEVAEVQQRVVAFHIETGKHILAKPDPPPSNTLLWACLHRLRNPAHPLRPLSAREIKNEVGMYTTAGFETTTATIGWLVYAAALHPDMQQRIYEELKEAGIVGGGIRAGDADTTPPPPPPLEDLSRLQYTNAFVNEVLRMYSPTSTAAARVTTQPTRVGGYLLPEGTSVWAMQFALHNVAANWEDPHTFRPERWIEDRDAAISLEARDASTMAGSAPSATTTTGSRANGKAAGGSNSVTSSAAHAATRAAGTRLAAAAGAKSNGVSAAAAPAGADDHNDDVGESGGGGGLPRRFLPFSYGPKDCVGQNFGLVIVRTAFTQLLANFKVELHPEMGGPEDTAKLTVVALSTRLTKLKVVLTPRD